MKTQININPITDNFLDRGFQNLLLPFRCFQHLVFLSSFSIEYNCIRPHRTSYYVVSLLGTLGFIVFYVGFFISKDLDEIVYKPNGSFILVFLKINVISLVIPFVLFYILNIIYRKDHVRLILKIQKAFRAINFKRYKTATIRNWSVILHSVGYIIGVAVTRDFLIAVYLYTLLYFDLTLTYGFSIIALIRDGIITWISEFEYYSKLSLELEEEKYNDKLKKLYEAYINLMEAFDIFKKIFKFATLFQTLDTFFRSLLYLEGIVELTKSGVTHFGSRDVVSIEIVTCLWTLKNISFVSLFSIYCENFYMSVSEADAACSRLLRSLQSTG